MLLSDVKLLLCPLNYTGQPAVSHTGLGVSCINTAKVLRANSINAIVMPIKNAADLAGVLLAQKPSHVVINALWMPTADLSALVQVNPHIQFAVVCHSNIAFLQVEPNGLRLLQDAVRLEQTAIGNFAVAGNSRAFQNAILSAWEAPCLYLPNLYYLSSTVQPNRPLWSGGTLRIGAFGAARPLKNPTSSAFAALQIASQLGTDLEFHINVGRSDGWGTRMVQAVEAIFTGLPHAKLVEDPWSLWPAFTLLIRNMHLLLQPSFTESFNIVTADGVSQGIASVVSDVIEWAPDNWKAPPDNVSAIARTGRILLSDSHAGREGFVALTNHNTDGVRQWISYLTSKTV